MSLMKVLLTQKAVRWRIELRLCDLGFHTADNRGLAQPHKRGAISSRYGPYTSFSLLGVGLMNQNAFRTCLR